MCTVGENIIATTKIGNSNIGLLFIAPCKVIILILFASFFVSVLCFFFYSFLKLSLLKAIAIRLPLLFANAFKSVKERQLLLSQYLEERYLYWKQNRKEAMNQSTKPIQQLKQHIKSDNFCYRKVGRAITKWGAIEKSPSLKCTKNYFAF